MADFRRWNQTRRCRAQTLPEIRSANGRAEPGARDASAMRPLRPAFPHCSCVDPDSQLSTSVRFFSRAFGLSAAEERGDHRISHHANSSDRPSKAVPASPGWRAPCRRARPVFRRGPSSPRRRDLSPIAGTAADRALTCPNAPPRSAPGVKPNEAVA